MDLEITEKNMNGTDDHDFFEDQEDFATVPAYDEELENQLIPPYIRDSITNQFSVLKPPPNVRFILTKKNPSGKVVGVASKGELIMGYGPPKCRKSTLLNCITASAFTNKLDLTLGFNLELTVNDRILYFDTEMPRTAYHRRQTKLNIMCGGEGKTDIDKFHAWSLKRNTFQERLEIIDFHIKRFKDDVALIVIDQMADLVGNINDRDQVNSLIESLSFWSDTTDSIIIGALHVTRNTELMTGVLGAELSKKMDSGFYMEKQRTTRYTKVQHLLSREEDVEDFEFDHDEYAFPVLVRDDITFK